MPVPSSVDTKSPASTVNAFGLSANSSTRKSNSGVYLRPTRALPLTVSTRVAPSNSFS